MEKLKVAVIGCGRISDMHLESIKNSDNAELIACCDVVKERVDKATRAYGGKAYIDYKTMIEENKLDVVHICLPHYLHVPVAINAMEKGVNVLSEKPMSIDYESAVKAVEVAKKSSVLYGVIFQCRYSKPAIFVKNIIESGKLGKIISASSVLTWYRDKEYYNDNDWKGTWKKEGGGVVINQAIHSIDLVNWLVDDQVQNISASIANRDHEYVEVEDCAEGLITYKSGIKYSFYCSNNYGCNEPIQIKLLCEKGRVCFDYDNAVVTYNDGSEEKVNQNDKAESKGEKYWGNTHALQIEQFYNSCLKKERLEISAEEALKTHKIVCDIYKKANVEMMK